VLIISKTGFVHIPKKVSTTERAEKRISFFCSLCGLCVLCGLSSY
jgi:hypothetical protein